MTDQPQNQSAVPMRQKLRKGLILFSFFLFPATFYYLSPALILEASAKGIINGSFICFALLFFSSLFLGRAFCGWLCPGAGCQESIFVVKDQPITRGNFFKWFIWIPWIGAIGFLAFQAGGYSSINFFFRTAHGFSIGDLQGLITYLYVLFPLIVFPAFVFGKRAFCHWLCWMAPFMIMGRKLRNLAKYPSLQLVTAPDRCKHCSSCSKNCPMSLPVEKMVHDNGMEHPECILCGTCVDGCRHQAIRYVWHNEKHVPIVFRR